MVQLVWIRIFTGTTVVEIRPYDPPVDPGRGGWPLSRSWTGRVANLIAVVLGLVFHAAEPLLVPPLQHEVGRRRSCCWFRFGSQQQPVSIGGVTIVPLHLTLMYTCEPSNHVCWLLLTEVNRSVKCELKIMFNIWKVAIKKENGERERDQKIQNARNSFVECRDNQQVPPHFPQIRKTWRQIYRGRTWKTENCDCLHFWD